MKRKDKLVGVFVKLPASVVRKINKICRATDSTQASVIISAFSSDRIHYQIVKGIDFHRENEKRYREMLEKYKKSKGEEVEKLVDSLMRRDKSKKGRDS